MINLLESYSVISPPIRAFYVIMSVFTPKVSVVIPVRNGDAFLAKAIESVLCQTFTNFELLVINDGSIDSSVAIVEEYSRKDERVFLVNAAKRGFANVLNEGIDKARAQYIARLDADDEMLPERLSVQCEFLEKNREIDLVATHIYYIDQYGKNRGEGGSAYHSPEEILAEQKSELVIGFQHPSVMFRKSAVVKMGGYRERLWPVEDVDLWTRMVEGGCRLTVLETVLTNYRVHPGAGSRSYESILKLDWVKACVVCRREQRPEQTWEEFLDAINELPLIERLSYRRKCLGKYLYRRASQDWLVGNKFKAKFKIATALILTPSHVKKRIKKFRRS